MYIGTNELELFSKILPNKPYFIESQLIHVVIQPNIHNITGVTAWFINILIILYFDSFAFYSNNIDINDKTNNIIEIIFLADKSIYGGSLYSV